MSEVATSPISSAYDEISAVPEPSPGQRMSADDFARLPKFATKYEQLEGVVTVSPAGLKHDRIIAKVLFEMELYLRQNSIGECYASSAGFRLSDEVVLSPDVSFVSIEKLPDGVTPEGFGSFAPDLVLEVLSPSDRANDVDAKADLYLKHGTKLVWLQLPKLGSAFVYRRDGTVRRVTADDALSGENVLPGFELKLRRVL